MTIQLPGRLSLGIRSTPFHALRRISKEVGGPTIWVKRDDLTGSAISGNKVRKLEFSFAAALEKGCDTIITVGGVESNHCRTTALLCAQLGLKCHLLLFGAESAPDGNLLLSKLAGAEITFFPADIYRDSKDQILEEWSQQYIKQGRNPYSIPAGGSDAVGLWGYVSAAQELARNFRENNINPGHIITATGSGGTHAGLIVGSALNKLGADIWGINVKNDEQYFLDRIRRDMRSWKTEYKQGLDIESLDINVIGGYVGEGYAIASAEVLAMIRQVAKMEGIILDPVYTGKAFYGMIEKIKQGLFEGSADIVFVHTGGVFGIFPQRERLFEGQ